MYVKNLHCHLNNYHKEKTIIHFFGDKFNSKRRKKITIYQIFLFTEMFISYDVKILLNNTLTLYTIGSDCNKLFHLKYNPCSSRKTGFKKKPSLIITVGQKKFSSFVKFELNLLITLLQTVCLLQYFFLYSE